MVCETSRIENLTVIIEIIESWWTFAKKKLIFFFKLESYYFIRKMDDIFAHIRQFYFHTKMIIFLPKTFYIFWWFVSNIIPSCHNMVSKKLEKKCNFEKPHCPFRHTFFALLFFIFSSLWLTQRIYSFSQNSFFFWSFQKEMKNISIYFMQ